MTFPAIFSRQLIPIVSIVFFFLKSLGHNRLSTGNKWPKTSTKKAEVINTKNNRISLDPGSKKEENVVFNVFPFPLYDYPVDMTAV